MREGSIVECVNDSNLPSDRIQTPIKGKMYTVIGFFKGGKGTGIFIEECDDIIRIEYSNGKVRDNLAPFNINRFLERLPPIEISIEETIHELL